DGGSPQTRICSRRPGPALQGICLAQSFSRHWPRADLFRGARSSPSRSDHDGGTPDGPSFAENGRCRVVAMEKGEELNAAGCSVLFARFCPCPGSASFFWTLTWVTNDFFGRMASRPSA